MSLKIIVINGNAADGKDSFVRFVKEQFEGIVLNHSTVDTVKAAAKLFGADEQICKGDAERRLWSDMKDAWTRYCDGPFNEILHKADVFEKNVAVDQPALFFVHVREPEEIGKLKTHFGSQCITLLVKGANTHVPDNHADQNVENYEYDALIDNTGTLEDLKRSAKAFIENLRLIENIRLPRINRNQIH